MGKVYWNVELKSVATISRRLLCNKKTSKYCGEYKMVEEKKKKQFNIAVKARRLVNVTYKALQKSPKNIVLVSL